MCMQMAHVYRAAWLAQLVEHQTFNLRVKGSSPLSGVTCSLRFAAILLPSE